MAKEFVEVSVLDDLVKEHNKTISYLKGEFDKVKVDTDILLEELENTRNKVSKLEMELAEAKSEQIGPLNLGALHSNQVLALLNTIHRVFPLPDDDETFKGTHAILKDRESGRLMIGIWYTNKEGKVSNRTIMFDEVGELIDTALLNKIKVPLITDEVFSE